jgi:hypothetical protein
MNAFRCAALGFAALTWFACESDPEWRDINRPASFGDVRDADAGTCTEPFECVLTPTAQSSLCTASCASDDDCPAWEATGHCAGYYQAPCENGFCRTSRGCR